MKTVAHMFNINVVTAKALSYSYHFPLGLLRTDCWPRDMTTCYIVPSNCTHSDKISVSLF